MSLEERVKVNHNVLLYEEWERFGFLLGYSMYTMYVQVYNQAWYFSVLFTLQYNIILTV